jgi:hypothetical protein
MLAVAGAFAQHYIVLSWPAGPPFPYFPNLMTPPFLHFFRISCLCVLRAVPRLGLDRLQREFDPEDEPFLLLSVLHHCFFFIS